MVRYIAPSLLMPLSAAGQALGFVDADQIAALWAGPLLLFVSDEASYPIFLNVFEIFDHAHAVFGSVAFIELLEPGAGKLFTADAELRFAALYSFAGFYMTYYACFWFVGIVGPAAGASIFFSRIGHAQPAVHPARSNQISRNRVSVS